MALAGVAFALYRRSRWRGARGVDPCGGDPEADASAYLSGAATLGSGEFAKLTGNGATSKEQQEEEDKVLTYLKTQVRLLLRTC